MICLGIESTAHTFGVGIVDDKKNVLANVKDSFVSEQGGMIPRELFDHHIFCAREVLDKALDQAKISLNDVDIISFSQGPGIGNALKVGAFVAKTISLKHNIPLVPVNHCISHVEIGRAVSKFDDPIVCYASGASTQVIGFENGYYRVFGETLDKGIGNVLDSFGRSIGLGFPAGPKIDKMFFEIKELIELPYTVKGMELAFSGLLTSAERKIGKVNEVDLAGSLMHNAFAMLTEVTERALAHTGKKQLVLAGGVAASSALNLMMKQMCDDRGCDFFCPPVGLCVDNGAMIGWTGLLLYSNGFSLDKNKIREIDILPKQRTDDVKVFWR